MPAQLTVLGIVVGLLLVASGGLVIAFLRTVPIAIPALMLCVGFGLVLAAFGARSGGSYGGFAIVGSAALAVALFVLLNTYLDQRPLAFVKKGQISMDSTLVSELQIFDEFPFYSWRDRNNNAYRFVILTDHLEGDEVEIRVDTRETGPGKEFFRLVGKSRDIVHRHLRNADGLIQWKLDYAKRVVRDGAEVAFSEPTEPNVHAGIAAPAGLPSRIAAWAPIGTARADELTPPVRVKDLTSNEPTTRRDARGAIAAAGSAAVRPVMDALAAPDADYRLKFGAVVSLTDIARQGGDAVARLRAALTDADLAVLAKLAGDPDQTTRVQAAEFLVLLGDPRIVAPSLSAAKSLDDNGLYNTTVVLRSIYPSLSVAEQKTVAETLSASIPDANTKTRALLKTFSGKSPTVYVQIADETQRSKAEGLRVKLQESGFVAPGIENVKGKAPSNFEVRYMGVGDVTNANQVAAIASGIGLADAKPKKIDGLGRDGAPVEVWFPARN